MSGVWWKAYKKYHVLHSWITEREKCDSICFFPLQVMTNFAPGSLVMFVSS